MNIQEVRRGGSTYFWNLTFFKLNKLFGIIIFLIEQRLILFGDIDRVEI